MGNRDYKIFGVGEYYHIYNRGNGKQDIFLSKEDFEFFILKLNQNLFPAKYKQKYFRTPPLPENSFSLICYCLMPNHFHFLIRQNREIPTSKLILRICTSYSKYFNKKYDKVGHLFQDQFKQIVIEDNEYLKWLSAYIHQNPKVARLSKEPEDYKWSSYYDYTKPGIRGVGLVQCEIDIILDQFNCQDDYLNFVSDSYEIIKTKKELEILLLD